MNSTIPAGLFELKARFVTLRTNHKFMREPIPDELRRTAAEMTRRYPPSLVRRILNLDPPGLKKTSTKKPARPRKQPAVGFFKPQPEVALPEIVLAKPRSYSAWSGLMRDVNPENLSRP